MLLSRCLYALSLLLVIYAVLIPIIFQPIGKWKGLAPFLRVLLVTFFECEWFSDATLSWLFVLLQVILHPQGLNVTRFFSGRAKSSRQY